MRDRGGTGARATIAVVAAIIMLGGACADDDDTISGISTTSDAGVVTSDRVEEAGGNGDESTDTIDRSPDTNDTADPSDQPVGDLDLALDECAYIPGGAIDGADVLNVNVFVLLAGTNELDERPRLLATEAGGLEFDRPATPDNEAVTPMQFSLDQSDLGRTVDFDVRVDPDNVIPETDELNNDLEVSLTIPSRRQEVIPLSCG